MFTKIQEGAVTVFVPEEKKISAKLPVFYNPIMKFNRDISIFLLKSIPDEDIQVCDLLAGTGIRSVRFLAELPKNKIKSILINDTNPKASEIIQKNLDLNKSIISALTNADKPAQITITSKEASLLLEESSGFDYIDIDPFGTPNPFLDSAVKRLSRRGILAVTATDTSALAGTYPEVCLRNYWAQPKRGPLQHELGIRILIRKVQLIATQYEKALIPIYSYSVEHYMRVFFRCEKGKKKCDEIIAKHGLFDDAGPIWLGDLWDKHLAKKIADLSKDRLTEIITEESNMDSVGFHDIHHLGKEEKINIPKYEAIMNAIKSAGFPASRTHFSEYGIRSTIPKDKLVQILKNIHTK
jgi:tRNA (guanine26-N2/guanine27-N2)-dimethyltransferase